MKTFCCCLPTRIGVLLLSPLTCAASMVCSVIAFYGLIQFYNELALGQRLFLGLLGTAMGIVAFSSIFGFFGALFQKFAAVSFYSNALMSLWLTVVATGVINFVFMYKDKEEFVDQCSSRSDVHFELNQIHTYVDKDNWCNKTFTIGFGLMVALWGAVSLLSLLLVRVVQQYCKQLAEARHSQREITYQV